MRSLKYSFSLGLSLGLSLLLQTGTAVAALGQAPSKLPAATASDTPPSRMLAASHALSAPYTVHSSELGSGTTVREFATLQGQVFAVAWSGPVLPDLSVLLGDYFPTFKAQAALARQRGRLGSPLAIAQDGLIVKSMGRMRNFYGHAYVPALVPNGVNIQDVLP